MTWKELKEFANGLTEAQLAKKVILWREIEGINNIQAMQLDSDHFATDESEGCYSREDVPTPEEGEFMVHQKGDPVLWEEF